MTRKDNSDLLEHGLFVPASDFETFFIYHDVNRPSSLKLPLFHVHPMIARFGKVLSGRLRTQSPQCVGSPSGGLTCQKGVEI